MKKDKTDDSAERGRNCWRMTSSRGERGNPSQEAGAGLGQEPGHFTHGRMGEGARESTDAACQWTDGVVRIHRGLSLRHRDWEWGTDMNSPLRVGGVTEPEKYSPIPTLHWELLITHFQWDSLLPLLLPAVWGQAQNTEQVGFTRTVI